MHAGRSSRTQCRLQTSTGTSPLPATSGDCTLSVSHFESPPSRLNAKQAKKTGQRCGAPVSAQAPSTKTRTRPSAAGKRKKLGSNEKNGFGVTIRRWHPPKASTMPSSSKAGCRSVGTYTAFGFGDTAALAIVTTRCRRRRHARMEVQKSRACEKAQAECDSLSNVAHKTVTTTTVHH